MRRRSRTLACLALVLMGVLGYLFLRGLPQFEALEATTLDWRYQFRGTRAPSDAVTIVAIDDRTVERLGGWPLPHDRLADAVNLIDAAAASAIVLDLLLVEPQRGTTANTNGHRRLAQAIERAGRVVVPTALTYGAQGKAPEAPAVNALNVLRHRGGALPPSATSALMPSSALSAAAAGMGHVNLLLDAHGKGQYVMPGLPLGQVVIPSVVTEAARLHMKLPREEVIWRIPGGLQLGSNFIATDSGGRWPINYYGPRGTLPTLSLGALLDREVSEDRFAGRIVWVGATAAGVGDTFSTPFSSVMPGVEVLASATSNLLENGFLKRPSWARGLDLTALVLLSLTAFGLAAAPSPRLAFPLILLPPLAWYLMAAIAFANWGLWLNVTIPALAAFLTGAVPLAVRAVRGERQRGHLAQYLPPKLADLMADTAAPQFVGREQQAVVLFTDLTGFTARSEALGVKGTMELLRQLHGLFERVSANHGGYVDSFSGDGAMLVFGVPDPDERDAVNALACARELVRVASAENLPLRVGLHRGPVIVARVGGTRQAHLTVVGDTVNVASRLENLAKQDGALLAASEQVISVARAQGREDLFADMANRPKQPLRGHVEPVDVWFLPDRP